MLKTLKWMYKLGYDRSRDQLIARVEGMAQFHRQQSQIAHYRKNEDDRVFDGKFPPKMSAEEHEITARALEDVLNWLDPQRFPNIERLMEKML